MVAPRLVLFTLQNRQKTRKHAATSGVQAGREASWSAPRRRGALPGGCILESVRRAYHSRMLARFRKSRTGFQLVPKCQSRRTSGTSSAGAFSKAAEYRRTPRCWRGFRSVSRSRSVLECAPQTGRFAGRMHSRKRQKSVSFQDARAIQEKQDGLPACPKVPVPKDLRHFVGGRVLESGGIPPHSKMLARFLERKAVAKRLGVRPAHGAL
jgi:hypothetical protein